MARTADKYFSFPIASITKSDDGDDLFVWGRATDATLDADEQVIDPAWSSGALKSWLATGGNVRMSHDARRPIGKGVSAETDKAGATWVKSEIVDREAQRLVRKKVLTAYSVGVGHPVIKSDPSGRARGGVIVGGSIIELTLCDRPSNPSTYITICKSVGGAAVYSGEVHKAKLSKLEKSLKARDKAFAETEKLLVKQQQASLLKAAASQLAANPEKWGRVNSLTQQEAVLRSWLDSDDPGDRLAAAAVLESRGVFA